MPRKKTYQWEQASSGQDEAPLSRSAKKRQSTSLQRLGEALLAMPAARRAQLPLPESLQQAIAAFMTMSSNEAKRRQKQYIGKLMREIDMAALLRALARMPNCLPEEVLATVREMQKKDLPAHEA